MTNRYLAQIEIFALGGKRLHNMLGNNKMELAKNVKDYLIAETINGDSATVTIHNTFNSMDIVAHFKMSPRKTFKNIMV